MELIRFKTTLKCNGCIAAVKPSLDAIDGLVKWEINLSTPDRILTTQVISADVNKKIVNAFKAAGYEAVLL
jgi:copper chaperone CopZ